MVQRDLLLNIDSFKNRNWLNFAVPFYNNFNSSKIYQFMA